MNNINNSYASISKGKEMENICSITGEEYYGCGHNAWPFKGRCSDYAEKRFVLPARILGVTPELIQSLGGNRAYAECMVNSNMWATCANNIRVITDKLKECMAIKSPIELTNVLMVDFLDEDDLNGCGFIISDSRLDENDEDYVQGVWQFESFLDGCGELTEGTIENIASSIYWTLIID